MLTLPHAARVAVLHNPDRPRAADQVEIVATSAKQLGLTPVFAPARNIGEVEGALSVVAGAHADALLVATDPMLYTQRARLVEFAAQQRLPSFYFWREFVEAGGLASYGSKLGDMHRLMASYVDKILKGTRPGDLPIEQPTRFELVVNVKTARSIGLTMPLSVLARADEVIE